MTTGTHVECHDEEARVTLIAEQNDRFRSGWPASGVPGKFVLTCEIAARPSTFRNACLSAVMAYDDFNEGIDPYRTHEMGAFDIEGERVWFRIDAYDERYEYGSEDPTDLSKTRRVLTILFPHEW